MDLGKYVTEYEAAQEQKRLEAAQEHGRQRIARSVNAEAAAKCIKEVIGPVLSRARDQLKAANCTIELIWKSTDDDFYKSSPVVTYGMEIILRAGPPGSAPIQCSRLRYYGSFTDQQIRCEMELTSGKNPRTEELFPISAVTEALIEQHLEKFAQGTFKIF